MEEKSVFLCVCVCVFFFALFLKNNACLHESTRLPHMVLIFLYESHILQICADKIAGHSSFILFFFSSWFIVNLVYSQALCSVSKFSLSKSISEMLQWKWAEEFKENFVFLFDWQKQLTFRKLVYINVYVHILSLRGDVKTSPMALFVGLPHFDCLQKAKQFSHLVASIQMFDIT